MKRLPTLLVLVAGLWIAAVPLLARHHGRGNSYDSSQVVTLEGTVTEFAWRNPHVVLYMDVTDEGGNVVNWGLESMNVSSLGRKGFSRNTLRVGQEVTAKLNPAFSGAARGVIRTIIFADGTEVLQFGGPIDD